MSQRINRCFIFTSLCCLLLSLNIAFVSSVLTDITTDPKNWTQNKRETNCHQRKTEQLCKIILKWKLTYFTDVISKQGYCLKKKLYKKQYHKDSGWLHRKYQNKDWTDGSINQLIHESTAKSTASEFLQWASTIYYQIKKH